MSTDLNDIEKQIDRAAEGQDTITPLTNSIFLRQLSKLKHQVGLGGSQQLAGSSKSVNSIDSSNRNSVETSFPFDSDLSGEESSSKKPPPAPRAPENLLSLFSNDRIKVQSNINSDLIRSVSSSAKHLATETRSSNAKKLVDALTSMVSFSQELSNAKTNLNDRQSRTPTKEDDDEIFMDADFINNVRLIVRHSETLKRHKMGKSIFACRVFMLMFFIVMMLMIGYFLKTVYSISESFKEIENFKHFGYARTTMLNEQKEFTMFNVTKKL